MRFITAPFLSQIGNRLAANHVTGSEACNACRAGLNGMILATADQRNLQNLPCPFSDGEDQLLLENSWINRRHVEKYICTFAAAQSLTKQPQRDADSNVKELNVILIEVSGKD